MEDINTLNNKLQSITKRLEEIQTKVLLQDEKVRWLRCGEILFFLH